MKAGSIISIRQLSRVQQRQHARSLPPLRKWRVDIGDLEFNRGQMKTVTARTQQQACELAHKDTPDDWVVHTVDCLGRVDNRR